METRSRVQSYVGFVVAFFMIFAKSAKIIAALKVLKFTKPLVTLVSMVISAFMYGLWLGPWFGIGLVAMIFIHEMGHIIALRMKGMETPGPVFIPFLGAAIFVPKFEDRDTESFVGFGGPLLGTIGALACFAAWPFVSGKAAEILLIVSYIGVFLNLFNLIPISPLDGGRVTQSIGVWFKWVGLTVLLVYTLASRQPALLLIWVLVLDGFDNLRLWLRPVLAALLGLSMAMLMALGYGDQPFWINVVDCFMVVVFTGMFYIRDRGRQKGYTEAVDDRPYPTAGTRAKWVVCYFALLLATSGVLAFQVAHLPQAVKSSAEQMTLPVDVPPIVQ